MGNETDGEESRNLKQEFYEIPNLLYISAKAQQTPFYNDHTAYAAALALFLPVLLAMFFSSGIKILPRILALLSAAAVIIAIIQSYTRAAWVGIFVAALAFIVFLFRINYNWCCLQWYLLFWLFC